MQQSMLLISVLWLLASAYVNVALGVEGVERKTGSVSTSQHSIPTEYHVAPNGCDDNPGTLQQPFASAAKALGQLRPGDTLYFHEGRYAAEDGNILDLSGLAGTEDLPIAMTRWRDDTVTFHGTRLIESDGWTRIEKDDAFYVRFREGAKWKLMLWERDPETGRERLIPDDQLTSQQVRQIDAYIKSVAGKHVRGEAVPAGDRRLGGGTRIRQGHHRREAQPMVAYE